MMVCDLGGYVIKDNTTATLISWTACSGGSGQPCHEDTHATLWRRLCTEELRPPTNSQHQLTKHVSEPPWK